MIPSIDKPHSLVGWTTQALESSDCGSGHISQRPDRIARMRKMGVTDIDMDNLSILRRAHGNSKLLRLQGGKFLGWAAGECGGYWYLCWKTQGTP